ncbi:hypothetical protein D3C78_1762790 [compost metagenome]
MSNTLATRDSDICTPWVRQICSAPTFRLRLCRSMSARALRRLRLLHSLPWRTLLLVKLLRKALR